MILQCWCVRIIIDDSKLSCCHVVMLSKLACCQRACLVLRCRLCLHICSDSCFSKVISYIEHIVVLIINSLADEVKLFSCSTSHDKECNDLFVLKTCTLLKD